MTPRAAKSAAIVLTRYSLWIAFSRPKERSGQPGRPPLVHGQRELLRAWAYSARFHTSSAFPPDEVRATPKVKSSPASLIIEHLGSVPSQVGNNLDHAKKVGVVPAASTE